MAALAHRTILHDGSLLTLLLDDATGKDQSDSKTSANVLIYCLLGHTLVNRRST
jgi:hypothetical protein